MRILEILEGTRCWKGYTKKGTKMLFGKRVPNCVKKTNESDKIELNENNHLIINDRNYFHNVTTLTNTNEKDTGYRDIFVFTTFS